MMKFDADSIVQRISTNLNENPDWKPLLNNSVISSLIRHNSEADAEIARYAEYLFNESRWDTAQNRSSVVSMANMLGYQPKRKISAHGKLYVSLDSKITRVGSTLTQEALEALDDASKRDATLYASWNKPTTDITITPACNVVDSKGNKYIVTSSTILKEGRCSCSLDIIQGERKTKTLDISTIRQIATKSRLNRYLYVPIKILNCEAAQTVSSKALLNIYVVKKNPVQGGKDILESYRVVDNLLLSSDGDKDVEFYNDLYNQDLFYIKFKDDPSRGESLDLTSNTSIKGIRIDYVESKGVESNISDLYEKFYVYNATPSGSNEGNSTVTLYGINYSALSGGANEELIYQIKANASKEYIKYYGVATKENYERVILNTVFPINLSGTPIPIIPRKVQVYGGYEEQNGVKNPVTNVSFIGTNLEDYLQGESKDEICTAINNSMNYCLSRLKSPQDTIRFVAPTYTSFAVGVTCKLRNVNSSQSQTIKDDILKFIDDRWSPNSSNLDFGRDFLNSNEQNALLNEFNIIHDVLPIEIEAVRKLNWSEAQRKNPYGGAIGSNTADSSFRAHTCRIPFDFSTVFKGTSTTKPGFKDYNNSSPYVMRVDFLYKAPKSMSGTESINRSIFIDSSIAKPNETRSKLKFYRLCEETISESLWPDFNELIASPDYDELGDADELGESYILDFQKKVYTDDSYNLLKNDIQKGKVAIRNASSLGTVANYLIYFSGDYSTEAAGDGNIGAGWIEFSFDEIYNVLIKYALYDTTLSQRLSTCSLQLLKCDTTNSDVFDNFKEIIRDYLEIYVCMRPNSSNLELQSSLLSRESGFNGSNEILYIDSYDAPLTDGGTKNLTSDKRERFISVDCSFMDL